jgi:hypothetical protein
VRKPRRHGGDGAWTRRADGEYYLATSENYLSIAGEQYGVPKDEVLMFAI